MTVDTKRRFEGMLSLLWVAPAFVVFEFYGAPRWYPGSLAFLLTLCLWWGIGLLFALSGMRSGWRPAVIAGAGTVLWFLFFLWDTFIPHVRG